jgi:arsenite methyltransferase
MKLAVVRTLAIISYYGQTKNTRQKGPEMNQTLPKKADYGLDAPPVIRNLIFAGASAVVAGIALNRLLIFAQPGVAVILLILGLFSGACLLATVILMLWSSKVGKLRMRDQLVDALGLNGNEIVLDIGCGRGLLLCAAARRLTTGKAIGIDLWQSADLSANRPQATLANAQVEGVAERVEIKTGDMRKLPLVDQTVDVVISSLAIHNVPDLEGRAQVMREINRVLKPGGRVTLLDMEFTGDYARTLTEIGWPGVQRSQLRFLIFPPVRIVTGKKPV